MKTLYYITDNDQRFEVLDFNKPNADDYSDVTVEEYTNGHDFCASADYEHIVVHNDDIDNYAYFRTNKELLDFICETDDLTSYMIYSHDCNAENDLMLETKRIRGKLSIAHALVLFQQDAIGGNVLISVKLNTNEYAITYLNSMLGFKGEKQDGRVYYPCVTKRELKRAYKLFNLHK
jgi:hypothetical protein